MRVAGQMLGSLLLGGVAILGSILIFRQGLLPLIEAAFHPGPELLSVFRRVGILSTAVTGYWAFVHWHEKREATELHLRPIQLMLGGDPGRADLPLPAIPGRRTGMGNEGGVGGASGGVRPSALGKRRTRWAQRCGNNADRSDVGGLALGRGLRPDAQPVGSSRQSRGMELHHSGEWPVAFRH